MTKKRNFKAILVSLLMSFLMIFSIFSFAGCGGDERGKEIEPAFVYGKLEEEVSKGVTRREKLLTSYDTYDYIEVEVDTYDPETEEVVMNEKIYLHQVEGDYLYYYEVAKFELDEDGLTVKTEHSYLLIKQIGVEQVLFVSYQDGDELVKIDGEIVTNEKMLQAAFAKFFADYYQASMLPEAEELIISAHKKTMAMDTNRMKSFEIRFNGAYQENDSINDVCFNYSTNKIHFVRNYTGAEEEMKLLREVEYTYPGNFVTNVEEIDMTKFSEHTHTWVPATCVTAKTCSGCQLTEGDVSGHNVVDGICTVCYDGAGAVVDGVYYVNFVDAVAAAPSGSTVKLMKDVLLSNALVISGKELTLDLNGKNITSSELQPDTALIKVDGAGSKLTITGEGTINSASQANDFSIAVWARNGGHVIINGGTFTNRNAKDTDSTNAPNNNELIYASGENSIIEITGGTFIGNLDNTTWGTRYTINLHDGSRETSKIEITGGSFVEFDPSDNLAEGEGTNFVKDGYETSKRTVDGKIIYTVRAYTE